MIAVRAAALVLALAAACGAPAAAPPPARPAANPTPPDAPPPAPRDPAMDEVLAAMRIMRDELCACMDAACVDEREAEQVQWAMAHRDLLARAANASKAQDAEAHDLNEAWERCADRARGEPSHHH